jgi:hypothetical protein
MAATFARPALALSLVLGAVLPGPAVGGESLPLKGNFTFHHSPPEPVSLDPLILFVEGDFSGKSTHLGTLTGSGEGLLDVDTLTFVGSFTWVAANGDEIFADFVGFEFPSDTPGIFDIVLSFKITGGTGRFAGASGSATAVGLDDPFDTMSVTGSFDGSISD